MFLYQRLFPEILGLVLFVTLQVRAAPDGSTDAQCPEVLAKTGATTADGGPVATEDQISAAEQLKYKCKAKFAFESVPSDPTAAKIIISYNGALHFMNYKVKVEDQRCPASSFFGVRDCMGSFLVTKLSPTDTGPGSTMADSRQVLCATLLDRCDAKVDWTEISNKVVKFNVVFEADGHNHYGYTSMKTAEQIAGYIPGSEKGDGVVEALGGLVGGGADKTGTSAPAKAVFTPETAAAPQ